MVLAQEKDSVQEKQKVRAEVKETGGEAGGEGARLGPGDGSGT